MAEKEELLTKVVYMLGHFTELLDEDDVCEDEELISLLQDDDYYVDLLTNTTQQREMVPKVVDYAEKVVSQFSPLIFKSHFRMLPETFDFLENSVSDKIINQSGRGRRSLDPRKQLLMTVWLSATPESFRSVSDRFGVSKSTLWCTCVKVWTAIASLSVNTIKFPVGAELEQNARDFEKICGFPDVIGCIDGCHIPIKAPVNFPKSYVKRMSFHSILLQGVVNSRCIFIDCYAGEVGSIHDARMFRRSNLGRNINTLVPVPYHLLGDSAYPLQNTLMTPFRDNGHLTNSQVKYNRKLSHTRSTVERAFGLLKGRFRRLKYADMQQVELISVFIMACCVLHNICESSNDFWNEVDMQAVNDHEVDGDATFTGEEKRNAIMHLL